MEGFTTLKG